MRRTLRHRTRRADHAALPAATVALALAFTLGACSTTSPTTMEFEPTLEVTREAGVVFMTQNVVHDATMSALFEGRVVADDDGCLRMDSPDQHTVIWPRGYAVSGRIGSDEVLVLDRDGEAVGTVGGEFTLAGGEVTQLTDEMGFTAEDRAAAAEHCPGRYWIVG